MNKANCMFNIDHIVGDIRLAVGIHFAAVGMRLVVGIRLAAVGTQEDSLQPEDNLQPVGNIVVVVGSFVGDI